jgi:triosephosphate isomerase
MRTKPLLFVANWKMNMPLSNAIAYIENNFERLNSLSKNQNSTLILCPSFPALYPMSQLTKNTAIHIGAQNCSSHEKGAYTGEVDPQSLKESGCSFCIIGHSERRTLFSETNTIVAQKASLLIKNSIQPILCIGETRKEYENQETFNVLTEQLRTVFESLKSALATQLCIAYEPVWAIGSGVIPEKEYLKKIFSWLDNHCSKHLPNSKVNLLYGGSVDEKNASDFIHINNIDGLLIGGASLDFQKFENIVLLGKEDI